MLEKVTRLGRASWVATLCAAAAVGACDRRGASDPGAGGACSTRLPDEMPPLAAAPAAVLPKSHISVGLEVAVDRLKRELGRQVPTTLARASRQDIGSPGEVTYVVKRGGFDVKLDGDRLRVSTPISADVEVCKPLGPFCPTYGRCAPQLLSTASLPIVLGKDYEVGASQVSVSLTKPCVIAGMDVSPEIRKMANQQAGGVQRRINGSVPPLRPSVEAGWKQLFVPVALGASTCLRITPDRLAQAWPTLHDGTLSARIAVSGALRVDQPCDLKTAETPTPLPALVVDDELPKDVALELPMQISWAETSSELSRSLKADASKPLRVSQVRAHGTTIDGKGTLALDVTIEGSTCGEARLLADPVWNEKASRLELTRVRLAPGQAKRAALLDGAGLEQLVGERAAIALPVDVTATPTALESLVERLTRERPEGIDVEVDVQPARIDRVLIDPAGLVPVASFRGKATIRVR